jgi:hypothetical protein
MEARRTRQRPAGSGDRLDHLAFLHDVRHSTADLERQFKIFGVHGDPAVPVTRRSPR